jgi:hypothetical protein
MAKKQSSTATIDRPNSDFDDAQPAAEDSPLDATADSLALFATVDKMLLAFIRSGRNHYNELTGGELLLCRRMAWDRDDIRRQISFRDSIIRHQKIAGTAADRQAAQQRLDAAKKKLSTEGMRLRDELDKITRELTTKISAMETEVTDANNAVYKISQAVASLRGLSPDHIKHDSGKAIQSARQEIANRVSELTIVISRIESITRLKFHDIGSKRHIADYCVAHAPQCLTGESERPHHPWRVLGGSPIVSEVLWNQHVAEQTAKLNSLRSQLRDARAAEAEAVANAEESSLSYYVPS